MAMSTMSSQTGPVAGTTAFSNDGPVAGTTAFSNDNDMFGFLDQNDMGQLGVDDGDGAEAQRQKFEHKKDLKIFLVDAHTTMSQTQVDGAEGKPPQSVLSVALRCVAESMRSQIITNPDDQIGICLYGTAEHKNKNNFPAVYVLHDLNVPDAMSIKTLDEMADANTIGDEIGSLSSKAFQFDRALWVCQTMFANNKAKNTIKSIHILTNNDDPSDGDDSYCRTARQKAADLRSTDVTMFLYKMDRGAGEPAFLTNRFFAQVMALDTEHGQDPDEDPRVKSSKTFEQLRDGIRKRQHALRSVGTLPLYLFDEHTRIAISMHTLVQKATKPGAIQLEATTNKPVKVETTSIHDVTGEILNPQEIGHNYTKLGQGQSNVVFTKEELVNIKDFGPPGVHLVGFAPLSQLKEQWNLTKASFCVPDDTIIEGSSQAFLALVTRMHARQVYCVASILARRTSAPKMVGESSSQLVVGTFTFSSVLHPQTTI